MSQKYKKKPPMPKTKEFPDVLFWELGSNFDR
jgi:hypothetical protein